MPTQPMTAWLITCEPMGDHVAVDNRFVDIVSARKSEDQIRKYLQALHDLYFHSLTERADFARYAEPPERPYQVNRSITQSGVIFTVGHNPILKARKVNNLVVSVDPETELETVTFDR